MILKILRKANFDVPTEFNLFRDNIEDLAAQGKGSLPGKVALLLEFATRGSDKLTGRYIEGFVNEAVFMLTRGPTNKFLKIQTHCAAVAANKKAPSVLLGEEYAISRAITRCILTGYLTEV